VGALGSRVKGCSTNAGQRAPHAPPAMESSDCSRDDVWRKDPRMRKSYFCVAERVLDLAILTNCIFSIISAFLTWHNWHNSSSVIFQAELRHQQNPFPSLYMTQFSSIINILPFEFLV